MSKKTLTSIATLICANGLSYGLDITDDFVNEGIITDTNGINLIAEGLNITNIGTIKSEESGIWTSSASNINTINNHGAIISEVLGTSYQNGISLQSYAQLTIKGINNTGTIIARINQENSHFSGNGIYIHAEYSRIQTENINNHGQISGFSISGNYVGNGILQKNQTSRNSNNLGNVINDGIISGKNLIARGSYSGNGIACLNPTRNYGAISNIGDINNSGIISGYSYTSGISGNGIVQYSGSGEGSIGNIINAGVIKGSNSAISGNYQSLTNNGILAGQSIADAAYTNSGITITLDDSGNIQNIINGSEGQVTLADESIKDVLNGVLDHTGSDSYLVMNNQSDANLIINGAGINKGALIVQGESSIDDSIVNGYNTAIYIEDEAYFKATNTIFNGGGLENNIAVIKGDDGANSADIMGNSTINGAVDLGAGNDQLTLANSVQINGMLSGGAGSDLLNLGQKSSTETLQVLHDINGFETINTNGKVTLFETTKVSGADNINLESGELILRIDPSKLLDGKVIGHALYENNGALTSNGGKLVIGLNGLSEGAIISMGGTTIAPDTNDSWWKDTDRLITSNSLVLDAKLSQDGNDVYITILEDIPGSNTDPLLYKQLNDVYQSIVGAGEIGNLANTTLLEDKTTEESLGALLVILDQMYANNPYSYTLKSTRDSIKLFEDHLTYLTIKPKAGELITQGKFLYSGVKNDNSAVGKNYYGFDTGHRNYKTTTNTEGALTSFEYGLSDFTSIGLVLGANHQDINFKGLSKIDANSLYTGTFAKTQVNNFQFIAGLGYQYTSANTKRRVTNGYDSFSTSDQYSINSFNTFIESKYIYLAEENWSIEPKFRVSYYMINQGNVNEGYTPEQISMRADKAKSNTVDLSLGVDFVKTIQFSQGKLKNIVSAEVINTLGERNKALNGYIIGKNTEGKRFDVQGVKLPSTSGKLGYTLEFEANQGMIYAAGISLEFAKDSNTNLNVSCGIGYKF